MGSMEFERVSLQVSFRRKSGETRKMTALRRDAVTRWPSSASDVAALAIPKPSSEAMLL